MAQVKDTFKAFEHRVQNPGAVVVQPDNGCRGLRHDYHPSFNYLASLAYKIFLTLPKRTDFSILKLCLTRKSLTSLSFTTSV